MTNQIEFTEKNLTSMQLQREEGRWLAVWVQREFDSICFVSFRFVFVIAISRIADHCACAGIESIGNNFFFFSGICFQQIFVVVFVCRRNKISNSNGVGMISWDSCCVSFLCLLDFRCCCVDSSSTRNKIDEKFEFSMLWHSTSPHWLFDSSFVPSSLIHCDIVIVILISKHQRNKSNVCHRSASE